MARARYYDVIQFPDPATGLIHKVSTAQITIYEQGTETLLAELIYQADSGSDVYTNPRTVTDGIVEFFLETEKRVSIKFDATGSGYGIITKNYENVWPDPSLLRSSIRSPNGLYVMSYDNNGYLTAPGLLSKYGAWDCEVDGGMTPGGNPATNTTLFEQLVSNVADKGGGDIEANESFNLNATGINHGKNVGGGGGRTINLIGGKGRGWFHFTGTAGPFLDFGTVEADRLDRSAIVDMTFTHANPVASGPTLYFGNYSNGLLLQNVKILNRGRPDVAQVAPCEGAMIGIQANVGFIMEGGKIELRTDPEFVSVGAPIGVYITNTGLIGGPFLTNVGIDGCLDRSYAVKFHGTGTVDTPKFNFCHIKDHERGIVQNSNVGTVANLQADGLFLDVITGTAIFLEPVTGGSAATWNFGNIWISALDAAVLLSDSNGGNVSNIHFYGGYFTNSLTRAVIVNSVNSNVYHNSFKDINILSSNSTEYGIDTGAAAYLRALMVQGCVVQVVSGSPGAARFSTAGQACKVDNNLWVGVNAVQGFTADADSSYSNNSFISSLI